MDMTIKEHCDSLRSLEAAYFAERLRFIEQFLSAHPKKSEQLAMLEEYMDGDLAATLAHSPWKKVRKALVSSPAAEAQVHAWVTIASCDLEGRDYETKAAMRVGNYAANGEILETLNSLINGL